MSEKNLAVAFTSCWLFYSGEGWVIDRLILLGEELMSHISQESFKQNPS